jgi:SAM-dependent methyltransferase
VLRLVKEALTHPLARDLAVDEGERVAVHRRILASKPLLRAVYERWYATVVPALEATRPLGGEAVEIGSGSGFLRELVPDLVTTDAAPNPFADRHVDAARLPFGDASLRALVMTSVLHHLPEPAKFFREAERCLKPGGRVVMVEPTNNLPQKVLVKLLGHYEYFDDDAASWDTPGSAGMSDANLSIPWIIFVRDRERFEREHPALRVRAIRTHTCFSLLLSGGMSFRSLVPAPLVPAVLALDDHLPFADRLAVMMTIELERAGT